MSRAVPWRVESATKTADYRYGTVRSPRTHLREYDSSTDCLYMFFDLSYEPWLELGPGLSQPEAFQKAQAWIWSSLSRPKPGHSCGFRAKLGLHITTVNLQGERW